MPSEPAILVQRLGRYALHGEIASGGMATIYLGRQFGQAGFARTVAIKRLHPQFAKEPDFVAMFLDEARLAARIRHPNVVPTLDVVADGGEIFLVMEYVHGESFAKLLRAARNSGAPRRVVAAIVADALHGLHAAHEATSERGEPLGIVHRDVSPHNVLVGVDGVARVVDFGVAKAAGRLQTTREGQLKGKLAYMAPEQITGTATRCSDVYAAAVMLWEALTRRRLFTGENDAAVMHKVLYADVAAPSVHVSELAGAWDEIVLRGLSRDPEARFATAREMALAIEARGEIARPTEVAAWVAELAKAQLAERAAQVSDVERGSDADVVAAPRTTPSSAPKESTGSRIMGLSVQAASAASAPAKRSRVGFFVGAAVVVGAALVLTLVLRSGASSPPASATRSTEAVAPPPATTPAAPPSTPTATTATAADTTAPEHAAAVASAPQQAPTAKPQAARTKPVASSAPATNKGTDLGSVLDTRQ